MMIKELTHQELEANVDRIAYLHLANFDDKRTIRQLREDILKYSQVPGFRCLVSHEGGYIDGYLLGYESSDDQFYRQLIDKHIDLEGRNKLDGAFEVVSMAVENSARHRGVGTNLLQQLTSEPGRYYLTANVHDVGVNAFYYKNNWKLVKNNLKLHPDIAHKNLYYYQTPVA